MKHNESRSRTLIEWGKNLLILLLFASAAYLTVQGQLPQLFSRQITAQSQGAPQPGQQTDGILPTRITACMDTDGTSYLYTTEYGASATDAAFQQVSTLYKEALSSVSSPTKITEIQWQQALLAAPGLHFELPAPTPLTALSAHLSAMEGLSLNDCTARLVLTIYRKEATLLYQNSADGNFYACAVSLVDSARLTAAVSSFVGIGAQYAFQSQDYTALSPYTLLLSQWPSPTVYSFTNPLTAETALEQLLGYLQFPSGGASYTTPTETVIRSGNDAVRISNNGDVSCTLSDSGSLYFPVSAAGENPTIYEQVAACLHLAQNTLGQLSGAARVHLLSAEEENGSLIVELCYTLDGAPVQLADGVSAAQFVVSGDKITQFTLKFRSFTATDETSILLPLPQTMGALSALTLEGQQLQLAYRTEYGDRVTARWMAMP